MPGCKLRGRTYYFVLGLIGTTGAFIVRSDVVVDGSRTSIQQHQRNGVAGGSFNTGSSKKRITQTFDITFEPAGKATANLVEPVVDWPEAPCIRTVEGLQPFRELWNIGIPEQPERPIGYSVLDPCTPIFIDRGGRHSDSEVPRGSGFVMEGFYEGTGSVGRIEVNMNALTHRTETYRAVVLGHEELHGVLAALDPAGLNQALLSKDVLGKARARLREVGYEGDDAEGEILPRLLTHDPDGIGLTGVAEEDRLISASMSKLLGESQTDPKLKRVYWQLQRSHALTHDVMSGRARIGALMCGRGQCPK